MTDEGTGQDRVVGPPWSVDVLADLHAGVLDEREAERLWPQVEADPQARAVIEALEATTADLAQLGSQPVAPVPADVAARIDAALAQERAAANGSNVVSLAAARRRRNRIAGWGGGFLAAAAAVVAAVLVAVPGGDDSTTPGVAQPAPSDEPVSGSPSLTLDSGGLEAAVGEVNGVRDFGPLGNEARLDACLQAGGIDPDTKPVGIRPATIDGQEAVIVLYTTGELAQFRLVALAPDCGPDNPGLLLDETVGRGG